MGTVSCASAACDQHHSMLSRPSMAMAGSCIPCNAARIQKPHAFAFLPAPGDHACLGPSEWWASCLRTPHEAIHHFLAVHKTLRDPHSNPTDALCQIWSQGQIQQMSTETRLQTSAQPQTSHDVFICADPHQEVPSAHLSLLQRGGIPL